MMLAVTFTAQSASTMAAVALFAANAERTWPVDDREPAATGEALRLLDGAVRAIAADRNVDNAKVEEAIKRYAAARTAYEQRPRGDADRPEATRDALIAGRKMIEALAGAVDRGDAGVRQQLAALKRAADDFDRHKRVREQAGTLEQYFHQAAALLRSLLHAEPTAP